MVEPTRNSGNNQGRTGQRGWTESGDVPEIIVLNDQGGGIMSVSDKPNTLRAQMKHYEPIICCAVKTKQIDMRTEDGKAHPLDSNDGKEPQAVCYAVEGNTVDRKSSKNGKGWCENVDPTLNTQDRHAVCVMEREISMMISEDRSNTLTQTD